MVRRGTSSSKASALIARPPPTPSPNGLARYARNRRLADALYQQAFSALTVSPGARAFYDRHRDRGATHHQALRTLANRLVGILHGCLRTHTPYDEDTAWAHQATAVA